MNWSYNPSVSGRIQRIYRKEWYEWLVVSVGGSKKRNSTDALYLPSLSWSEYTWSLSYRPQEELKLSGSRKVDQNSTANWWKKDLHDSDSHDGVTTNLEPDILECKVEWAFGLITTNKASGGDIIPVELFQILKNDAVKVLQSICQQIWKTQQWPQDWKRSVFIPIPKRGNAKGCSNYHTVVLISHTSKVMLKILQARLQ